MRENTTAFRLGRSDHWSRKAIDVALGLHIGPPEDDWRSRCKAYQTEPPTKELQATGSDAPAIFTPERLAEHWGMSVAKIYKLASAGQVVGFRLGKRLIRFRAAEVAAAEERMNLAR